LNKYNHGSNPSELCTNYFAFVIKDTLLVLLIILLVLFPGIFLLLLFIQGIIPKKNHLENAILSKPQIYPDFEDQNNSMRCVKPIGLINQKMNINHTDIRLYFYPNLMTNWKKLL